MMTLSLVTAVAVSYR